MHILLNHVNNYFCLSVTQNLIEFFIVFLIQTHTNLIKLWLEVDA